MLLGLEIGAIVALLAAGIFLWQMQRTLRAELRWAREAEASVNAYATATHGADSLAEAALPAGTELRRLRIPDLGIDYGLRAEALRSATTDTGQAAHYRVQLQLPVAVYGEGVCRLQQLQTGDNVFLETVQGRYAYEIVAADGQRVGAASGRSVVEIVGYPCGDRGRNVLVSAIRISH